MSEPRDTNPRPSRGHPRAHMGWTIVAIAALVVIAAVIWGTTDYSRTASKSEDQTHGAKHAGRAPLVRPARPAICPPMRADLPALGKRHERPTLDARRSRVAITEGWGYDPGR
jgi:hypothetical protein